MSYPVVNHNTNGCLLRIVSSSFANFNKKYPARDTHVRRQKTMEIHCVGITWPHLIMSVKQEKKQPIQLIRLLLDEKSVVMTSPLFSHAVELEEKDDHFVVVKWIGCALRIKATKSDDFMRQMRIIVKQSFFPLLQKTVLVQDWQKEMFPWEIYHRGMATKYRDDFVLSDWMVRELGEAAYWKAYAKTFKAPLKEAIDALPMKKDNVIIDNMPYLFGLFDHWKCQHIACYFRCRLMEMSTMRELVEFDIDIPTAKLNTAGINDLLQFYKMLQVIDQECRLPRVEYHDFAKLCQHTLAGRMYGLIKNPTNEKRRLIYEAVLLPKVIADVEERAKKDASTVYPVNVKSLLYHYQLLFDTPVSDATVYHLDDEDDECQVLQFFIDKLPWRPVPFQRDNLKKNSVLFIVLVKDDINKKEERIFQLLDKELHCDVSVVSSEWSIDEWQKFYLTLDDVELQLYDVRLTFVQYPLVQFKEAIDMHHLDKLLQENIFESMIIRPPHSHYTMDKCRRHFSSTLSQIDYVDLKQNLFDMKEALSRDYAKALIIVVDCHLFSYDEMLELLTWINKKKIDVKRVVMMSVCDTLPLHTSGQPFIDLIQWTEPGYIQSGIFDASAFNEENDKLIDACASGLSLSSQYNNIKEIVLQRKDRPHALTLYYILSPQENKKDRQFMLDSLRGNMTIKFVSNNNITIRAVTLADLYQLVRQPGDFFFLSMSYLSVLTRNEMNHLLLEIDNLTVVSSDARIIDGKMKWFKRAIKQQTFPNLRYSMPYVHKMIGLST